MQSIEDQIHELIRDRIVRSEYPPGSKLQLVPISEEFEVSTMPVRAALKRLASEGFADYRPNRGAVVTGLDYRSFVDIQDIRISIEGLAARLGAVAISDEDIAVMTDILMSLEAGLSAGDIEEIRALEWQGNLICYEAADRPRLVNLIIEHGRLSERYSRALLASDQVHQVVLVDHYRALVEACSRHSAVDAEQAVITGLTHFRARLAEKLSGS